MKGNKAILTCLVGLAWQCSSRAEAAPSYPNFPSRSAAAQALERRKQELFARAREEQESTLAAARAAATSIANQAAAEFETQRNALTQQAAERRQLLALEARERIAREQERAFLLLSTAANSANAAVDRIGRASFPSNTGIIRRKPVKKSKDMPEAVKLIIGAGGIYCAFLYYGSLQEDVFRYKAVDGSSFKQAWFLQVLEAIANVIIGFIGMQIAGPTTGIPLKMFGIAGAAQVSAKACTSLALANGLSFPVATLAKSGKMAPVMAGSLLIGGASYALREYLQVAAVIGGTAVLSIGKKSGNSQNSLLGVSYIVISLILDGVTAGFQKRLKVETSKVGVKPLPYDFMFWTNVFMALTAVVIAAGIGEIASGVKFCTANPEIFEMIIKFSLCSAVGQSFIFYTIANFDPLVLSTVTTSRKIFSVLLSIFLKGHSLSGMGWSGIGLATSGIVSELLNKRGAGHAKPRRV